MAAATKSGLPERLRGSLDCKQGAVRAVRYNVDGCYCLTCGSDKTLKLWNPQRKTLLKTYSGHGYEVLDARASCDNSQLLSGGMDKTVIVWDVSSGLALRKYRGHVGTVNCVRFNEDSSLALSGALDGSVRAWDVRTKRQEPVQIMEECKDSVTSMDVSDYEILIGCADQKLRRYDLRNGQLFTDLIGSAISSVCFTRDGQCVLVASSDPTADPTVKLFDKSTGELLQEFRGHVNKDYRIDAVLNHTDQAVLSGSENGLVFAWDLVEGKVLGMLDHNKVKIEDTGEEEIAPALAGMMAAAQGRLTVHSLTYHPKRCELLTAAKNRIYFWTGEADEVED